MFGANFPCQVSASSWIELLRQMSISVYGNEHRDIYLFWSSTILIFWGIFLHLAWVAVVSSLLAGYLIYAPTMFNRGFPWTFIPKQYFAVLVSVMWVKSLYLVCSVRGTMRGDWYECNGEKSQACRRPVVLGQRHWGETETGEWWCKRENLGLVAEAGDWGWEPGGLQLSIWDQLGKEKKAD